VKKLRLKNKHIYYVGVLMLSIGVAVLVYSIQSTNGIVSYGDALRPLKDTEVPNEQKPTSQEVQAHSNKDTRAPQRVSISKLGILARVIPIGTDKNGKIESPANIYDIGWYNASSSFLASEGFAVLDGHVQGQTKKGVFAELENLATGDGIIVELADGAKVGFTVEEKKIIAYDEAPQTTLLAPHKPGTFELRLITCTGSYSSETRTYDKRLVVTARKQ
jgi:sortase (surface protein transpeptidase)